MGVVFAPRRARAMTPTIVARKRATRRPMSIRPVRICRSR